MLKIEISENCPHCGEAMSAKAIIRTQSSEGHRDVWRPGEKYVRYTEPYPVWHHRGFSGEDGHYLTLSCKECGSEYSLKTGTISLYCDDIDIEDVDEAILDQEYNRRAKETSFLKWLKSQYARGDTVGDFAHETFWADGYPKGQKQQAYRDYPAWPKRATSRKAWLTFLEKKGTLENGITAFKIAWDEYQYLREPRG